MKRKLFSKHTILIVVLCIVIMLLVFFIKNGFENDFIYKLPNEDGSSNDVYGLLLSLYQTRVEVGNWVVAVVGAVLTFIAFYVQYIFNARQKEDLLQERYENQLFHLLDVYRDICHNTSMINVGSGKVVFHYMFYEYKAIYNIIKTTDAILKEIRIEPDEDIVNYIAFTYFLNGVSPNMVETTISDSIFSLEGKIRLRDLLLDHQSKSLNSSDKQLEVGVVYLKDYSNLKIKYFDGHRFRFMPYIKYVTLIVEFMAAGKCVSDDYIKFLSREQTEHEIGLIYAYNGYVKYEQRFNSSRRKDQSDNSDNHKSTDRLWPLIYDDIPQYIRYKFMFNGDNNHGFLS